MRLRINGRFLSLAIVAVLGTACQPDVNITLPDNFNLNNNGGGTNGGQNGAGHGSLQLHPTDQSLAVGDTDVRTGTLTLPSAGDTTLVVVQLGNCLGQSVVTFAKTKELEWGITIRSIAVSAGRCSFKVSLRADAAVFQDLFVSVLEITRPDTTISVSPTTVTLYVNGAGNSACPSTFTPTVATVPLGLKVIATSGNTAVAQTNGNAITAVGIGTAIITYALDVNRGIKTTVTVTVQNCAGSGNLGVVLEYTPVTDAQHNGNECRLWSHQTQWRVKDKNGNTSGVDQGALFSVLTPGVIIVNNTGLIRPVANGLTGTTKVVAKWAVDTMVTDTITVTVDAVACGSTTSATSITFTPTTWTLVVGETYQLTPTINAPAGASRAISWSTSNSAIIDVDGGGVIKCLTPGTTQVSATIGGGAGFAYGTYRCVVAGTAVVNLKIVASNGTTMTKGGTTQQLGVVISPASTADQSVTWFSSNPSVASVNPQTGVVTTYIAGTAVIWVKLRTNPTSASPAPITINVQ